MPALFSCVSCISWFALLRRHGEAIGSQLNGTPDEEVVAASEHLTHKKQRPTPQVGTAKEALLVTLNERGCVDLDYEDMRNKLLARGVPADDIAFVQDAESDAAKLQLFRDVRAGKVRILFGSTRKMGTGTNVQERLIALHHLDAPWRPADVEQREGRILRQGNSNAEVQIYRYVTEQSFDAYLWQVLETKARFIAQVMTGETDLRRIEDIDGAALTYAAVKPIASGNPLVIEKARTDAEVARLSRLHCEHQQTQFKLRTCVRHLTDELPRLAQRRAGVRQDLATRQDTGGDKFTIVIEGQEIRDRGIASALLMRRAERMAGTGAERQVGTLAGFRVFVADNALRGPEIVLKVDTPFEYAERLAELVRRQDEIENALDLTKSQVPGQVEAEQPDPAAGIEDARASARVTA